MDVDLLEARAEIAQLQRALDRASARIRELEGALAMSNARAALAETSARRLQEGPRHAPLGPMRPT